MTSQLQNVWHLRKVAEASAKPCDICYKPTNSVLITPDQKDHFYICLGHLQDKGFCTPIIDEAEAAAKKKKEELDREIELIKKEFEEKVKKRKNSKESKHKEKGKEKEKATDDKLKSSKKDDEEDDQSAEKEKDNKVDQHQLQYKSDIDVFQINALINNGSTTASDERPRLFALQKAFHQRRLDRIRHTEIAKRNRERLRSPALFPSVPSGDLA